MPSISEEDNEQTARIKSNALAELGINAVMQTDYKKAEAIFRSYLDVYKDKEDAPMVHLELANTIKEQGRADEAWAMISEGMDTYRDNEEYVQMARELQQSF